MTIISFDRTKNLALLIIDMKNVVEMITKGLRQSGLKLNDMKTEICLFHQKGHPLIQINTNHAIIPSLSSMGVLGLVFDNKLQYRPQIQNTFIKSNKAPCNSSDLEIL